MKTRTRRELLGDAVLVGSALAHPTLLGAALDAEAGQPAVESPDVEQAQAPPDGPGQARAAWRELVEALRACDAPFVDEARGGFDEGELAYGYRYLSHLMSFVTDVYLYGDPDAPVFRSVQDAPFEKTLGGHPDVHYAFAPVRGDRRYRITGRRGDEAYLSFTLHRGTRGSGLEQSFDSHLNHHRLETDPDGRFEIIVSPTREGRNWLRSSPDATEIYARAYVLDRTRDAPATFRIEALDANAPRPLRLKDQIERIRWATRALREMSEAFIQPLEAPNRIGELWQIEPEGPSRFWQAVDNVYCRGVYALQPSEALVLEGRVVPCDYWGIQLWSPCGMGSGDYRLGPVSINTSQAHLGPKGEFRVAIARENPNVPGLDWISTAGARRGTFFVRWMVPRSQPPAPRCRLTTLETLRS